MATRGRPAAASRILTRDQLRAAKAAAEELERRLTGEIASAEMQVESLTRAIMDMNHLCSDLELTIAQQQQREIALQGSLDLELQLLEEESNQVSTVEAAIAELRAKLASSDGNVASLESRIARCRDTTVDKRKQLAAMTSSSSEKLLYAEIRVDKREKVLLEELLRLQEEAGRCEEGLGEVRGHLREKYRDPLTIFAEDATDPPSQAIAELEESLATLQDLSGIVSNADLQLRLQREHDVHRQTVGKCSAHITTARHENEMLAQMVAQLKEETTELRNKANEAAMSTPSALPYLLRTPQWTKTLAILRGEEGLGEERRGEGEEAGSKRQAHVKALGNHWISEALGASPKPLPSLADVALNGRGGSDDITSALLSDAPHTERSDLEARVTREGKPENHKRGAAPTTVRRGSVSAKSRHPESRSVSPPSAAPGPKISAKQRMAVQKVAINRRVKEEEMMKIRALQQRLWRGRRAGSPEPVDAVPPVQGGKLTSVRRGSYFGMYKGAETEAAPPPAEPPLEAAGLLADDGSDNEKADPQAARSKRHRDSTRDALVAKERGWGMRGQQHYLATRLGGSPPSATVSPPDQAPKSKQARMHAIHEFDGSPGQQTSRSDAEMPRSARSASSLLPKAGAGPDAAKSPIQLDPATEALLNKYRSLIDKADEASSPSKVVSPSQGAVKQQTSPSQSGRKLALSTLVIDDSGLVSLRPTTPSMPPDRLSSPKRVASTRKDHTGMQAANVISAHANEFFGNSLRSASGRPMPASRTSKAPPSPSHKQVRPKSVSPSKRADEVTQDKAIAPASAKRAGPPPPPPTRRYPKVSGAALFNVLEQEARGHHFENQIMEMSNGHIDNYDSSSSHLHSDDVFTLERLATEDHTTLSSPASLGKQPKKSGNPAYHHDFAPRGPSVGRLRRIPSLSENLPVERRRRSQDAVSGFASLASMSSSFATKLRGSDPKPVSQAPKRKAPKPRPQAPVMLADSEFQATEAAIVAATAALAEPAPQPAKSMDARYEMSLRHSRDVESPSSAVTRYARSSLAPSELVGAGSGYSDRSRTQRPEVEPAPVNGPADPGSPDLNLEAAKSLLDAAQAFLMMHGPVAST